MIYNIYISPQHPAHRPGQARVGAARGDCPGDGSGHYNLSPIVYCLFLGHLRQGLHPLHVPIRRRLQAGCDKPSQSTVSRVGQTDPCCPMGRILESFNQCCRKGSFILIV